MIWIIVAAIAGAGGGFALAYFAFPRKVPVIVGVGAGGQLFEERTYTGRYVAQGFLEHNGQRYIVMPRRSLPENVTVFPEDLNQEEPKI